VFGSSSCLNPVQFYTIEGLLYLRMIRIYWTQTSTVDHATKSKQIVQRWEGGWWFSEEVDSSDRSTYQVVDRLDYTEKMDGCFIELLKPLPSDFVESPCWKEATPMCWSLLFENSEGVSLLAAAAGALEQQLLLSFPASLEFDSLPSQVFQHISLPTMKMLFDAMRLQLHIPHDSKRNLPSSALKQTQTHSRVSEASPEYRSPSSEHVPSQQGQQKKGVDKPLPQSSKSTHASPGPKGIQTGSLCQPMTLPEKEVRPESTHHKKAHRKPRSQTQPMRCLIQLSES